MIVLFPLAAFAYWNYLLAPTDTSANAKTVSVDIPAGSNVQKIGERLEKAGVIRSKTVFTLMAKVMGESTDMKAGEYAISKNLGVIEIINKMVAGDAIAQWVIIPEGLTLGQIAERLHERRLADTGPFINAVHHKPETLGLSIPISRHSVDGYLMPDTYRFPKQLSERQIIKEMLRNWNVKVLRPYSASFRASDLPMDKIVVLASLIEREAKVPQDRPLISSVIRNRLKRNMKLEIDATVIYALGKHKDKLSFADLKVKSPYNTYLKWGLPPSPICNPGIACIDAALKPAKTSYLYYVAQPDGSHLFATTFAEHKANIARVKAMSGESASAGSGRS